MSTMRSTNEAKRAELRGVQRSPSTYKQPKSNTKMQPPLLIRLIAIPFLGGEACSRGILRRRRGGVKHVRSASGREIYVVRRDLPAGKPPVCKDLAEFYCTFDCGWTRVSMRQLGIKRRKKIGFF